ncbi:MAG: hypothetical protein IJU54_01000 [Alphaproteobacteria bacterium]|nr:hypothetical protein [Alphaproteobacteria bacterium]
MQKLNFILPKIVVNKVDTETIKQCILSNWKSIIPSNIFAFIKLNKLLITRSFQLKVFMNILGSSIIIIKMYEKEIIGNIKDITRIEDVYIYYQQVLSINDDITKS